MQIWTENGVFIIFNLISIPIGKDSYVRKYSDNREYFYWENSKFEYQIK